ncbi:hypothetical protein F5X68DRAFT_237993 [Plectosphaerella plurivora]|uniref:Uncharacterized protein n=1 Tax=Plectosphaerella plurivora TaxID=936078 RepID=A0A9P8UUK7_9PEZI|nr:hypothetical protein F5X68DRAFT_237993 [Plectosphaerella plurivora]
MTPRSFFLLSEESLVIGGDRLLGLASLGHDSLETAANVGPLVIDHGAAALGNRFLDLAKLVLDSLKACSENVDPLELRGVLGGELPFLLGEDSLATLGNRGFNLANLLLQALKASADGVAAVDNCLLRFDNPGPHAFKARAELDSLVQQMFGGVVEVGHARLDGANVSIEPFDVLDLFGVHGFKPMPLLGENSVAPAGDRALKIGHVLGNGLGDLLATFGLPRGEFGLAFALERLHFSLQLAEEVLPLALDLSFDLWKDFGFTVSKPLLKFLSVLLFLRLGPRSFSLAILFLDGLEDATDPLDLAGDHVDERWRGHPPSIAAPPKVMLSGLKDPGNVLEAHLVLGIHNLMQTR